MEQMYEAIPFSPKTELTADIGETDTIIYVSDVSAFPDGPCLATIGTDSEVAETIRYAAKTDNALSGCERGIEGKARAWNAGDVIARNFTAVDAEAMRKNIDTAIPKDEVGVRYRIGKDTNGVYIESIGGDST